MSDVFAQYRKNHINALITHHSKTPKMLVDVCIRDKRDIYSSVE